MRVKAGVELGCFVCHDDDKSISTPECLVYRPCNCEGINSLSE